MRTVYLYIGVIIAYFGWQQLLNLRMSEQLGTDITNWYT